jgi:xylulokinase
MMCEANPPRAHSVKDFVLGIDLGTTRLKVVALSQDGVVRASAHAAYSSVAPHMGEAEQDPQTWRDALLLALAELGARVDLARVASVGLSGQTHGLVLVDSTGRALTPCMTWADTRCRAEAAELRGAVGDLVRDRCGNPILEAFTAPKMLWAARHWADQVRDARLCLPKDYLRWWITDRWATDPSDAASTLVFDLPDQRWSSTLVNAVGWRTEQLPEIEPSSAVAGHVTADFAAATGLAEGTPVVTGASDVACAAFGAGLLRPGATYINLGTAAQVLAVADGPQAGPGFVFQHCLPGRFLSMGSLYAAGLSLRWFVEGFRPTGPATRRGQSEYARLDRLASQVPPGSAGLLFLPYLTGRSLPRPDPLARGAFVGLTTGHGWAHCARAILEGVAYGLRDALESLETSGMPSHGLTLGGGGGAGPVWPAILACVLGRNVSVLAQESSPLGAAMLAGIGIGLFESADAAVERCVRVRSTCPPRPDVVGVYEDGYRAFRDAGERLGPLSPALARMASHTTDG